MNNLTHGFQGKEPLMSFFLQPFPKEVYGEEEESVYNPHLQINENKHGVPLFMGRSAKPPTSCITPGHMIKAGYTPSGKYRPAKWSNTKADKRAGK